MGLKTVDISFRELAAEKTLRSDYDYLNFQQHSKKEEFYSFGELFTIPYLNKVDLESLDEDFYYAEIGNVSKDGNVIPAALNFVKRGPEDENYYKKIEEGNIIKPSPGDILISKVRPNLKKYVIIDETTEHIYFTSAFAVIRPSKIGKILFYALRSTFYENLIVISRQGKGYPTINEDDLSYLKFDRKIVDNFINNKDALLKAIEPCEHRIRLLQTQIKKTVDVIDEVFDREFSFNFSKFEDTKKTKFYELELSAAANNKDIRNSFPFHHDSARYVMQELAKVSKNKIKHYLAEPIVLGASIKPEDFSAAGEYYYVSMATVKNYKLEVDETQRVSKEYAQTNKSKHIKKNDIIMTRSGAAIGKFALVEDDVKAVFADFTMRIRLKNYLPLMAYYYFRSTYFQHLIHSHKKGLQNKNIFPGQIQEFPMIDLSIKEQQVIVDEIQQKLNAQNDIFEEILSTRNKIELVLQSATNSPK